MSKGCRNVLILYLIGVNVFLLFVLQVVRQSNNDQVTVIGAGVTLHEALAAHDILAKEG